jgi:hypothetical protein
MFKKLLRETFRYAREGLPVLTIHNPVSGDCSCGISDCRRNATHSSLQTSTPSVDEVEQEEKRLAQSAESIADKAKADRLAALDAQAFHWIARGREANRELGRIFNEIKSILKHGEWEPYFENTFRKRGIALRTAQVYMQLASEPDMVSDADPALFPPATDPLALAISHAAEEARSAVAIVGDQVPERSESAGEKHLPRDGTYKLSLSMTGHEMVMTDELRGSQNWPDAEMEIITFLQQLHIKYVTYPEAAADAAQTGEALEEEADDEDPLAYA